MSDAALAATQFPIGAESSAERPGISTGTRFERITAIGEGGMGRVERVRDRDLHRDIAIKHLQPQFRDSASLVAQFLWEARVTAYLDHPNIVPVHDIGRSASGELFFAMKLVRGETLEAAIARWRTQPDATAMRQVQRRIRLFLQLCQAIGYAHARGVLHRDLKPANVMIGEYGELLVTDWGLALPLLDSSGDSIRAVAPPGLESMSAGTPMYMSPEQIRGDSLDARSDLYALGVVLYELVALKHPIVASNVADVLAAASAGEFRPITTAAPGIPSSIAAVISKAMARDRDHRYRRVSELVADLETTLEGRTPDAEDASLLRRAARFYVGRDRSFADLRPVDLDAWVVAGILFGAGIGARWIPKGSPIWWIAIALGLVIASAAATRWVRSYRAGRARGDAA